MIDVYINGRKRVEIIHDTCSKCYHCIGSVNIFDYTNKGVLIQSIEDLGYVRVGSYKS